MPRKALSESVVADLMVKTRRRCCLCVYLEGNGSRKRLQLAHIDRNSSNDAVDNLVPLCLEHHDEYDSTTRQSKNINPQEVRAYRDRLIREIASGVLTFGETKAREELVAEALTELDDARSYAFCVLFAEIERILLKHDPIGIAEGGPSEYDTEAYDIAKGLRKANGGLDIEILCHGVIASWFLPSVADGFAGYPQLASNIENAWNRYVASVASYQAGKDRYKEPRTA
ncbi:HNH endonuclease signature motif containing protein [Sorangium sp. So ce887]|uniref:HNH endonuclease signature motif containing protein n=1 Tax=Sorangium sp. So ce887 TaxID=3133324 RepID=UPI003F611531